MNPYNKHNVALFKEDMVDGYICSVCGQIISLDHSVSNRGYNLVCIRCTRKIGYIFGMNDWLARIQRVGQEMAEIEEGGTCHGMCLLPFLRLQ